MTTCTSLGRLTLSVLSWNAPVGLCSCFQLATIVAWGKQANFLVLDRKQQQHLSWLNFILEGNVLAQIINLISWLVQITFSLGCWLAMDLLIQMLIILITMLLLVLSDSREKRIVYRFCICVYWLLCLSCCSVLLFFCFIMLYYCVNNSNNNWLMTIIFILTAHKLCKTSISTKYDFIFTQNVVLNIN